MSESGRIRESRRVRIAIVVAAVVVLGLGGYWVMTEGPGARLLSPPRSTLVEFSGSGDQTTEPFRARSGWQIEWRTSANQFAMAIRGDLDLGTVVRRNEPGSGVTTPPTPGTFHLEITADGPWTIAIIQGS